MVLFIPLGVLLGAAVSGETHSAAGLIGAAASAVIELVQLVGKLGLFESDDMIYNTAGCLIGVLVGSVITVLFKKKC